MCPRHSRVAHEGGRCEKCVVGRDPPAPPPPAPARVAHPGPDRLRPVHVFTRFVSLLRTGTLGGYAKFSACPKFLIDFVVLLLVQTRFEGRPTSKLERPPPPPPRGDEEITGDKSRFLLFHPCCKNKIDGSISPPGAVDV
ncbi:hypothetical protein EVAR_27705_1 [Eumeta japonica]|uniref:Uncharacterized protein n=1 Tax=Eumeta variegata TaxID=151549 RepID=A0A4C1WQG7_EUMVA|nr:hypothetical protein EVAR_27705_1 [Eumeta japonica]